MFVHHKFWLLIIVATVCFVSSILLINDPPSGGMFKSYWIFVCIGTLIMFFVLLNSKNPERLLFVLLILSLSVNFGIHLVHREENVSGPGGIYISLTFVISVIILLLWLFRLTSWKKVTLNYFPSISIPALAIILAGMLSMINTSDRLLSICGIFQYSKYFLLYFITANMVRDRGDVWLVIKVLFVVLILQGLVYIPQNVLRIGEGIGDESLSLFRARGTMDSPALMADFFSSILLMSLGVIFTRIRSPLKSVAMIAFIVGIPALILTFCRAPIIAFCLNLILGIWYGLKKRWIGWGPIVGLSVIVGIAVLFLWPMMSARINADHAEGLKERNNLMKIAWNVIEDNPIIGVGISNYNERYKAYIPDELMNTWIYVVHNQYLLIWAETGTIGFITFAWFLLAVIKKGIRCVRRGDDFWAPLSLGFLLGFLTILFHMYWGIFVGEQINFYIWFLVGMIAAMEKLSIHREQRQDSYSTA